MTLLELSHDLVNAAVFIVCIIALLFLEPISAFLGGAL